MRRPSDLSNKIYNNYKRYIPEELDENLAKLVDPIIKSVIQSISVTMYEELNDIVKQERLRNAKKNVIKRSEEEKNES
jgi:hypothetical protein